jgi:hypothetical protein
MFSGKIVDERTHLFLEQCYLVFININTKYVEVYPLKINETRTQDFVIKCFVDMLFKNFKIDNIRADADITYDAADLKKFLQKRGISYFFSKSKFINKNRCVDRVIRTIRDAVGINRELFLLDRVIQTVVFYYNNTPHRAYNNIFTPRQVQNDRELDALVYSKTTC